MGSIPAEPGRAADTSWRFLILVATVSVMSDGLELSPEVRAAAVRVQMASASDPGTDTFRTQLQIEIGNTGERVPDGTIEAITAAMASGTFSRY